MRVTVLGCGGSGGVPLVGEGWGACNPTNPKNRRRRVSILVEQGDTAILVDASPDLRQQLLDAECHRLDAVFFTHDHADHSHGIDDLRFVKRPPGGTLPAIGDGATLASLSERFGYIFRQSTVGSGTLYRPFLRAVELAGPFTLGGIKVRPFEQDHGHGSKTIGYRIGNMAYSTDVVELSEAAFAALAGLDLWVVDCLRFEPHTTHAHFAKTLGWIERVRPKHAVLTHLNHMADYDAVASRCPPGVEPAYDGLVIDIPDAASDLSASPAR
jgi:phosphoribosyl 1,2-cyclic phosphate phosphodiesterase